MWSASFSVLTVVTLLIVGTNTEKQSTNDRVLATTKLSSSYFQQPNTSQTLPKIRENHELKSKSILSKDLKESNCLECSTLPYFQHTLLTSEFYQVGFSRPHPEICPLLGAKLKLIILVSSNPLNMQERDAIRMTWGHTGYKNIALAFVMGALTSSQQETVDEEDALYGDLIIGKFVDSHLSRTTKTLSMMKWVDKYCPKVPLLLKTNDHMFINIFKLLNFIETKSNATNTIWGKVVRGDQPKRRENSRHYVSVKQYPKKVYPDYVTGSAYLMTTDNCGTIWKAALAVPYFCLEDVFVTGVVAEKLGIKLEPASEFYNKRVAPHPCTIRKGIAMHTIRYYELFTLWVQLLNARSIYKCTDV